MLKISEIIDTAEFDSMLLNESRKAFTTIIDEYRQERIYFIGLYHSGSYSYIFPIVLTRDDLETVEDQQSLRWSEGDSEYHGEYETATEQSDEILHKLSSDVETHHLENKLGDYSIFADYKNYIEESIVRVFKTLETEGVFSSIGDRNSYVLGCVCGDQSVMDKYQFAMKLNPEEALEELAVDAKYFEKQRQKIFDQFRNR